MCRKGEALSGDHDMVIVQKRKSIETLVLEAGMIWYVRKSHKFHSNRKRTIPKFESGCDQVDEWSSLKRPL